MGLETGAVIALVSAGLSAVGGGVSAVMSHNAQKDAAKQAEMNAEAQRDAVLQERQRKEAENAENQRRLAVQERRERATQAAAMAETGLVTTTGTPLAITADTMASQQQRRGDLLTSGRLDTWQLDAQGNAIWQEGRNQARNLRSQAGATLLTGLVGSASSGLNTYNNLS